MYKKKIQTLQNKCIRFCLSLDNRHHVGFQEFKNTNWLPTKQRYEQNVCTKVHNFFYHEAPFYMNEIFQENVISYNTRNSFKSLQIPRKRTEIGKNSLSFHGPKCWNYLQVEIKHIQNRNTFKHSIKDHFFKVISSIETSSRSHLGYHSEIGFSYVV